MATAKKPKKNEAVQLTGQAIRYLRGLGHKLNPVVSIGKNGITEALIVQTAGALESHELVKVRVQGEAPVDRHEAGPLVAAATSSVLVQVLGRTLLLYKPHPEKPRLVLVLPRKKRPAPAQAPRTPSPEAEVDDEN